MKWQKIPYNYEELWFLKRNRRMVRKKLCRKFNEEFSREVSCENIKRLMFRRGWGTGRTGRFKKGHTPHPNAYPKGPSETSFKKGHVPKNIKPLWAERMSNDGYVEIKVPEKDPHTGSPTRYRSAHVWMWEQIYGAVPKGFVIAFADGDKTNCEPDNLESISRGELGMRNRLHYSEQPSEIKKTMRNIIKLQIKIRKVESKEERNNLAGRY